MPVSRTLKQIPTKHKDTNCKEITLLHVVS